MILQQEASTEEKRKQHQRELANQVNEEAKLRLAQNKVQFLISRQHFSSLHSTHSSSNFLKIIVTIDRIILMEVMNPAGKDKRLQSYKFVYIFCREMPAERKFESRLYLTNLQKICQKKTK